MARACRLLEQEGYKGSLNTLARSLAFSPTHFHRVFKRCLGITPQAYKSMHRMNRFRRELHRRHDVTAAVYEAGFRSVSRAYDSVSFKLGMTPRQYQKGGVGILIHFALTRTSLGWLLLAVTGRGVCAVELGARASRLRKRLRESFPEAQLYEDQHRLAPFMQELLAYLEMPDQGLNLPLDVRGTAFQRKVWEALRAIPTGSTMSYRSIAQKLGVPQAARAVGNACAANRIALAIPCHRAVRQSGKPGGYRWGLGRKRVLLRMETKRTTV